MAGSAALMRTGSDRWGRSEEAALMDAAFLAGGGADGLVDPVWRMRARPILPDAASTYHGPVSPMMIAERC